MKSEPKPKIGAGHLPAAFRQGLGEIGNSLTTDSNVVQPYREYGLYGTMTPGEIADARRNSDPTFHQEQPRNDSILESRMSLAERNAPSKDAREIEMDR